MYTCGDCHQDDVVEISAFGDPARRFMCVDCGSERILHTDAHGNRYERYSPPSVGKMVHRLAVTEQSLPPTAMELSIRAEKNKEARADLLDLLDELRG